MDSRAGSELAGMSIFVLKYASKFPVTGFGLSSSDLKQR